MRGTENLYFVCSEEFQGFRYDLPIFLFSVGSIFSVAPSSPNSAQKCQQQSNLTLEVSLFYSFQKHGNHIWELYKYFNIENP